MFRYQSKILLIVTSFVFLAAWFTIASPVASPLAAGVDSANNSIFQDVCDATRTICQELNSITGDDWSRDVALGDLDGNGTIDAFVVQGGGDSPQSNVIWLGDSGSDCSNPFNYEPHFCEGASVGEGDSRGVALADLDGDTDLDVYIANGGSGDTGDEVWLNQGGTQGGVLGAFSQSQVIANGASEAVALADLNNDTYPDAVVAGYSEQRIYWNQGDGTFNLVLTTDVVISAPFYDVAVADLDSDTQPDIVLAGNADGFSDPTQVFWIESSGPLSATITAGPVLTTSLGINGGLGLGLLNNDAFPDVFIANSGANKVWFSNGDRTFTAGADLGSDDDSNVALADFEGDGDLDAFVTRLAGFPSPNGVWLNDGSGGFSAGMDSLGSGSSHAVALADMDGDGDPDAIVANSGPNKVWLNEGGGGNGNPGFFSAGAQDLESGSGQSTDVALGDLDEDGDLDAILPSFNSGEVWVNGPAGDPTGFSLTQVIGSSNAFGHGVVLGDVDGDGDLDAFFFFIGFEIWLNGEGGNPPGTLSPGQRGGTPAKLFDAALADLDGDGDLDALIASKIGLDVSLEVWLNGENGDPPGVFSQSQVLPFVASSLALGDLDGDSDVDAFTIGLRTMRVLLNGEGGNPPGVYSLGQEIISDDISSAVALGDLDGDGDLDAFVVTSGPNTFFINGFLGVPGNEGTFKDSGQRLGNSNSTDVALGDLDGDGDLDAFTTTGFEEVRSQSNEIWENGSGNLGIQCLGSEESRDVALGDLDGDGDLDAFVVNWMQPDKVWFNGQGAFCSCTVAWLYEEDAPLGIGNSPVASGNLFSYLSLGSGLQTYLDLRDDLFSQYPNGRRYARLYDDYNAEIFSLLFSNSALRDEGLSVLQLWQPGLQALLDGQGDSTTISAAQVLAVDDFLTNLSAVASPDLQQVIAAERAKLPPPSTFIGMTLEEARGIVLPDLIYLPSILRQ